MSVTQRRRRALLVVGPVAGGIGVHVASLATGLPRLGWDATVLTTPASAARFDFGPDVHTVWPDHLAVVAGRVLNLRSAARQDVIDADVVHAHGHQAGVVALGLTGWTGAARRPVVVSLAQRQPGHRGGPPGARPDRAVAGAARRPGAPAPPATSSSGPARSGARAVRLAPVAAPPAGTSPATGTRRAGRSPTSSAWTRTCPGCSPCPGSRRRRTCTSWWTPSARLAEVVPHQWLVVGDGDEELAARLWGRIADTEAPVQLVGARADVPRLMAVCDVFALASAWEARALVVQEAFAAGLPVVATDVGGLTDLVEGAGVLVPPATLPGWPGRWASCWSTADRRATSAPPGSSVRAAAGRGRRARRCGPRRTSGSADAVGRRRADRWSATAPST